MSDYTYSYKETGGNTAKAVGLNLPISLKQSVMVCRALRRKRVDAAIEVLEKCISMAQPIRFTRFNRDMGHKRGMGAGRFPVKACAEIKKILESARTNAQFKGLSTSALIVEHISAKKGTSTFRYGRHFRRSAKRTTVEVVLMEAPAEKKAKEEKSRKEKGKAAPTKQEAEKAVKPEAKPAKREEKKEPEAAETEKEKPEAAPKEEPAAAKKLEEEKKAEEEEQSKQKESQSQKKKSEKNEEKNNQNQKGDPKAEPSKPEEGTGASS